MYYQYETAAGHAVAARGGVRDAGPENREPTARREPQLESPAFRRGGDVKKKPLAPFRTRRGVGASTRPGRDKELILNEQWGGPRAGERPWARPRPRSGRRPS